VSKRKHNVFLATVLGVIVASTSVAGFAQDSNSWIRNYRLKYSRDSVAMTRLVKPLISKVDQSIVRVRVDEKLVSLGTIVGADGYVLTKRSELSRDPIRVQLHNGRSYPARVAAVRPQNDLALLKIDSQDNFVPVSFETEPPEIGSFLISPLTGTGVGIGTISVHHRRLDHIGRLGVTLHSADAGGASVSSVYPDSGADHAGILLHDRIVAINGQDQSDDKGAQETLGRMFPGDVVRLTIVRKGSTMEMDARIREMAIVGETENDIKVNGPRNARLTGFDRVIQHDTVLTPEQCGGPVLDSHGKVVGMNIARAGRVVSYALPASLILPEMVTMLQEARSAN